MTWHEVQQRLLLAQRTHHLCIHKAELTELDIHNRLLRFKNYEVALVNKGILPSRIHLPIFGDMSVVLFIDIVLIEFILESHLQLVLNLIYV